MLNYNDYIFEQKLELIFSNLNENMKWVSENEVEWDLVEKQISKSNEEFWNIISSLSENTKKIAGILITKVIPLLKDLTTEQAKKLLDKLVYYVRKFITNSGLRKKLIYLMVIFITSTTLLSVNAVNDNIKKDIKGINTEIERGTISKMDPIYLKHKVLPNKKSEKSLNVSHKGPIDMSLNGFLDKLAFKESTNNWKAIKYTIKVDKKKKTKKKIPRYVGKYQLGNIAFKDIKSDIRVHKFVEDPNIWTEAQQDKDIIKLMKKNKYYLRNYLDYIGNTINGVKITESGLLAASHLVGNGGVRKFLKSNGEEDPADGNGTKCSTYMKHFGGYELNLD